MRRAACPLLGLLLLALLLAGCPAPPSGSTSSEGGSKAQAPAQRGEPQLAPQRELTLWTVWNAEPRRSALQAVVAGFEKQNPGTRITISNLEPDAYKTKIRVALGGGNPPDIFFVWSGEKMLTSFIRGGNCLDLTPYMDAKGGQWRSRLISASLAPYLFGGKVYGVPYLLQCTFFFYNKDLLARSGVAVPKTWDELVAVCRKLKAAGITPLALGNGERWPAHHYPCVLFQRLMGHRAVTVQYDPLGPGDYSDPGWVKGLTIFQDFYKQGFFNPNPNGVSRNDARMLFYTQKAAMFYSGTWDFAQFSEKGEAPRSFWTQWDFCNFPSVPGAKGEQDALEGSADGYVVSAKTKFPDLAAAFLSYLTSPQVARQFVTSCKELVQVKGAVTPQNSSWYLAKYAWMVEHAKTISPWTDTLMERSVAETLMNGIQGMMAGEKTPEQIMAEVRQRQAMVKREMQAE